MRTITRPLMPHEVTYGLLDVHRLDRVLFPAPGHPITVIDEADGQTYPWYMHRAQPRIDGLTALYRKHGYRRDTALHGDTVTIERRLGEDDTVRVRFGRAAPFAPRVLEALRKDGASLAEIVHELWASLYAPAAPRWDDLSARQQAQSTQVCAQTILPRLHQEHTHDR